LSLVNVLCCQVEFFGTGLSLVQRSSTDCYASLCVIYKPEEWGGHGPRWVAAPQKMHVAIAKLNDNALWYLEFMLPSYPLEELTICGRGFLKGPHYRRASVKFFEFIQPTHPCIHLLIQTSIHPPVNPSSQPSIHLSK
jgi:hypothetical protein